jgi:hypothetical protein
VNSGKSQLLIVAMGYCPFIGEDLLRLMRRVENPLGQTLDDVSDGNEFSGAREVHHRERAVGSSEQLDGALDTTAAGGLSRSSYLGPHCRVQLTRDVVELSIGECTM